MSRVALQQQLAWATAKALARPTLDGSPATRAGDGDDPKHRRSAAPQFAGSACTVMVKLPSRSRCRA
jgi:hypothetical protein